MRQVLLFVLCCALLGSVASSGPNVYNSVGEPHTFNGTNYVNYTSTTTEDGGNALVASVECDNTINGVATSATDVGDGTITVRGCGNKIFNVTTVTGAQANVSIYGMNNDVENDVVKAAEFEGMGPMPSVQPSVVVGFGDGSASGNTVVGNAVDHILMTDATDNVVTGNTAGALFVQSSANNSVTGNVAATGINVHAGSWNNELVNNQADYIQLGHAFHADVESNHADYDLEFNYVNYRFNPHTGNGPASIGDFQVDDNAVIAACDVPYDQTTNGGVGVECTLTLPPGHMLSAGTTTIAGTNCTGSTYLAIYDSANLDTALAQFPPINDRHRRSLLNGPPLGCSFATYINKGDESLDITIMAACFMADCTGTVKYGITSLKTTVIKHNTANNINLIHVTSDIVESNTADYDLAIGNNGIQSNVAVQGVTFTNNSAGTVVLYDEQQDAFHRDLIDHNHIDANFNVRHSNNLTVTNNTGARCFCCICVSAINLTVFSPFLQCLSWHSRIPKAALSWAQTC